MLAHTAKTTAVAALSAPLFAMSALPLEAADVYRGLATREVDASTNTYNVKRDKIKSSFSWHPGFSFFDSVANLQKANTQQQHKCILKLETSGPVPVGELGANGQPQGGVQGTHVQNLANLAAIDDSANVGGSQPAGHRTLYFRNPVTEPEKAIRDQVDGLLQMARQNGNLSQYIVPAQHNITCQYRQTNVN